MQSGTAIGLLVGGAVLLLAVTPRKPTSATAPATAPGGALNPFNWFSGGVVAANPNAIFPQQAAPQYPLQPGNYVPSSPNWNPGGFQNANYTPNYGAASPAAATPNYGWGAAPTPGQVAYNSAVLTGAASPAPGGLQAAYTVPDSMAPSPYSPAQQQWA